MNSNRLLALATVFSLTASGLAAAADQRAPEKLQTPAATSAPAGDKAAGGDAAQASGKKHAKKHMKKDVPAKQEDKKS